MISLNITLIFFVLQPTQKKKKKKNSKIRDNFFLKIIKQIITTELSEAHKIVKQPA
jgi:hypothetical protein